MHTKMAFEWRLPDATGKKIVTVYICKRTFSRLEASVTYTYGGLAVACPTSLTV